MPRTFHGRKQFALHKSVMALSCHGIQVASNSARKSRAHLLVNAIRAQENELRSCAVLEPPEITWCAAQV